MNNNMCIIVAKEKGIQLPTKNTLKKCFENNSDGAGIMYVKNNEVIIEKGLMTFGEFWHKIKDLKKEFNSDLSEKALVMHFRIGTHGENDKATTHPFPISGNAEDLRRTYFKTTIGMAHNGIMSDFNYDKVLSDTQSFVKDYVSVFKELNENFIKNERVVKLITQKANIKNNKLCFLDKNENIYWYGDKVIDNGVIYSNSTFKSTRYVHTSTYKNYSNYNYGYGYGYGYDSYGYDSYDYYNWFNKKETKTKTKDEPKISTLEDFTRKKVKYEVLETGDFWQTRTGGDFVKPEELLIIDENKNLYECIGDDNVSLIGINTTIYDRNFEIKPLSFNGLFQ